MEDIWASVRKTLNGDGSFIEECDVQEGNGYEKLIVKQSICYIVAAVIINDKGEVLMVQEAKLSCYKRWYLPAGRMEPNETIVEAVKREVLEEAGLEFEPTTLLCVEECGGKWVRFAFIGKVIGGKLKTPAEADEESLQAMWWDRKEDIPIRCKDVLPLIKLGVECHGIDSTETVFLMPSLQAHKLFFLRILLMHNLPDTEEEICILLHETSKDFDESCSTKPIKTEYRIPTSRIHPEDISFRGAIHSLCKAKLTGQSFHSFKICGIFGIEHLGESSTGHDGLGVDVVVELTANDKLLACKEGYKWVRLSEINDKTTVLLLKNKLNTLNLIPLRSLKASL